MAAERISPRGEARDDLRIGILVCAVLNKLRGERETPVTPAQVMPYLQEIAKNDPGAAAQKRKQSMAGAGRQDDPALFAGARKRKRRR